MTEELLNDDILTNINKLYYKIDDKLDMTGLTVNNRTTVTATWLKHLNELVLIIKDQAQEEVTK